MPFDNILGNSQWSQISSAAESVLSCLIPLPPPPKYWDYWHVPPLDPPPSPLPPLSVLLFFMSEFSGCDKQDYNDTSPNCQTEELIKDTSYFWVWDGLNSDEVLCRGRRRIPCCGQKCHQGTTGRRSGISERRPASPVTSTSISPESSDRPLGLILGQFSYLQNRDNFFFSLYFDET